MELRLSGLAASAISPAQMNCILNIIAFVFYHFRGIKKILDPPTPLCGTEDQTHSPVHASQCSTTELHPQPF